MILNLKSTQNAIAGGNGRSGGDEGIWCGHGLRKVREQGHPSAQGRPISGRHPLKGDGHSTLCAFSCPCLPRGFAPCFLFFFQPPLKLGFLHAQALGGAVSWVQVDLGAKTVQAHGKDPCPVANPKDWCIQVVTSPLAPVSIG